VLRWGMPLSTAALFWQFYNNTDYIVVGRMMESEALGWYTLGFSLASLVNDILLSSIASVSRHFPLCKTVLNWSNTGFK